MSGSRIWERLGALELELVELRVRPLELAVSEVFTRTTSVIELHGREGLLGVGEDVSWARDDHVELWARVEALSRELAGRCTLAEFSERLERAPLFGAPPSAPAHADYRRWAFESAALDLALASAGQTLAECVQREARPLRFVASLGLGRPASTQPVRALLERVPGLEFKLDVGADWDAALVGELAELGCVATADLKGYYRGTTVDLDYDAELYARVCAGLPRAVIEDPLWNAASHALLAPHAERIAMDAPLHSWADLEALPYAARWANSKPSRFGRAERVFEFLERCEAAEIQVYGGGQFELGPGRAQIQELAALFHPEAPNDVAPLDYHQPAGKELAPSPLPLGAARAGFARRAPA